MILVTGGTGFIGRHLLEKLVSSGCAVRALVRRQPPPQLAVETVHADLVTGEGLEKALEGADTVIHLAGITKALRPEDYYQGNARATENLARALPEHEIRLVHVSSLAAVGPSTGGKVVTEDTEPHPFTHYGRSKLEAERVVRALRPDAVIVRPPVVYGPRDTGLLAVLRPIARGFSLAIGGSERFYSVVFVKDLVEGLLAAAHEQHAAGRTYFLAHPEPMSWSSLISTAGRLMGRSPAVLRVPPVVARAVGYGAEVWSQVTRKPGIVSREKVDEAQCTWTCDPARAAAELGFEARTPLETGLAETLAWYKEAGWLKY